MAEDSDNETILLFGRDFTALDLWIVTETVRRFPKLSQTELANTIYENLRMGVAKWPQQSGILSSAF
jgi:hypothetical protein